MLPGMDVPSLAVPISEAQLRKQREEGTVSGTLQLADGTTVNYTDIKVWHR
jgi:hypothetical protein